MYFFKFNFLVFGFPNDQLKFPKVSVGSGYVKFKRKQFILNTFGKDITIH